MYSDYAKVRDILGLKDADVCKRTGISPGTMSDWKSGRYELKLDKLKKIADALGVGVSAFMDDESTAFQIDAEVASFAKLISENPELRSLVRVATDSKAEDVRMATDMLSRFKEKK